MAKTFVQRGDVLTHLNGGSATITSGTMVRIGAILAIALADILVGATGAVSVTGVWALPKVSATAVSAGDVLDYTAATGLLDVGITAATGDLTGAAVATADAGVGVATVDALLLAGNGTPA